MTKADLRKIGVKERDKRLAAMVTSLALLEKHLPRKNARWHKALQKEIADFPKMARVENYWLRNLEYEVLGCTNALRPDSEQDYTDLIMALEFLISQLKNNPKTGRFSPGGIL